MTVCDDFNTLKIWFVATEEPNTYRLEAVDNYWLIGLPEYVTFSTPDPKMYPLPNPTYLTIHATCAKVAHLSGAREYIEEMLRCMEDTCVLADDDYLDICIYTGPSGGYAAVVVQIPSTQRHRLEGRSEHRSKENQMVKSSNTSASDA